MEYKMFFGKPEGTDDFEDLHISRKLIIVVFK